MHTLTVLPPKAGPKEELTAPNMIASLIHPERKASIWTVAFSPDGARLFTAGYPSGIVQFWDVASCTEVRRIDTPHTPTIVDSVATVFPAKIHLHALKIA